MCFVHLLSAGRVGLFRRVREQEAVTLTGRLDASPGPAVRPSISASSSPSTPTSSCRAPLSVTRARVLFGVDDSDSSRRQRKVFTDFQKLIGTAPVRELLPWLGWVDAITRLEAEDQANV